MISKQFDWADYFKMADELAKRSDEAALRTALSRAYYYVFHLALNRAQSNGFSIREGEASHPQLWRNYSLSPEPACNKLAQIAGRLKEKRRKADYEQIYARLDDDIDGALADAQDFASRLIKLPARFPDPKSMRQ